MGNETEYWNRRVFPAGGVHRQGEDSLDVSADLNELGRSNTLVVCSGVKSILDIGRTLEYLVTTYLLSLSYDITLKELWKFMLDQFSNLRFHSMRSYIKIKDLVSYVSRRHNSTM